jgi:hypothetical protein
MRGEQLMSHSSATSMGGNKGGGAAPFVQVESDDSFKKGYEVDIRKRWKKQPPNTSQEEFTSMRYLPVLPSDPIEFDSDGYEMRAKQLNRRSVRVLPSLGRSHLTLCLDGLLDAFLLLVMFAASSL